MRVVQYEPSLAGAFKRLNLEWIERHFAVEQADLDVLDDPSGHVLDSGGRILFAVDDDGDVVGCVALKHDGDGVYEVSKMAVAPDRRGAGVGRLLMDALLEVFHELGGIRLYLESNRKLEAALSLYERSGFVHRAPPHPSPYSRADVYMVWEGRR